MADNTNKDVLLSLGFDEATLNEELDKLKAKIIDFFKNLNLSPQGTSPLSGITDVAGLKAFNLEVNKLKSQLDNLKTGLDLAKGALKSQGLTDKEVAAATKDLAKDVDSLEKQYIQLSNAVTNSTKVSNQQVNTQKQLAGAINTTTKQLVNFNVQQNVGNAFQQRSTKFLESFTFQAGVLGFALIRTGRIMEQFGKSMLTFIKSTSEADAGLKVLRDSLESNDFSQGKLDQLRKSFRSVDESLRSAFGTNNIELIQRQGFTVANIVDVIQKGLSANDRQLLISARGWDNLEESIKHVKERLGNLFGPGITQIADTLEKRIVPAVDKIVADFNTLSPALQTFISTVAISIPGLLIGFGVLSKVIGLMISGAAVIAKAFSFVQGVFTAAAGESAGAGFVGVLEGLSKLIVPIGLVLTAIIAIAENAHHLRDDLVGAAKDSADAFNKLADAMSRIANSKVGGFIVDVLVGALQSIISLITTIVSVGLEGVIQAFGILSDLVSAVLDEITAIFDSATWAEASKRVENIFATLTLRTIQRIGKIVYAFFEGLVEFGTIVFGKLHIISQADIDQINQAVARWRTQFIDTKYSVDATTGAIKAETEEINTNTTATAANTDVAQHNADAVKQQQAAYDALALSVDKARESALKAAGKASIQSLTEQAKQAEQQIKDLSNSFKDSLDNLFDPQAINSKLSQVEAAIKKQETLLEGLQQRIGGAKKLGDIQELGTTAVVQDAIKALNAESLTSGGELVYKLNAIFDAQSLKAADVAVKSFTAALDKKVKDGSITKALYDSLNFILSNIASLANTADADAQAALNKASADATAAVRASRKAADERQIQLNKEIANNQLQQTLSDEDQQIVEKRAAIADLETQVEQFRLTNTYARQKRIALEVDIAHLEFERDRAKLARDRQLINPNDPNAITANDQQLANRQQELQNRLSEIRKKGAADEAKDEETSILNRNKRFKSASEEALKILAPFNDLITKGFAAAFLTGDKDKAVSVFRRLADDIKLVGGSIPEIKKFADVLATETSPGKILEAFLGLNQFPAQQELTNTIDELIKQVQAIVLSELETQGGKVTGGGNLSPAALLFFGLKPGETIDAAATQIGAKLRETGLAGIQSALTDKGTFQSSAEVEASLGLLARAKSIQAEIEQINISGRLEISKKIVEETSKEHIAAIESDIKDLEAKLSDSQARTATQLINTEVDTQRQLAIKIIDANQQKEQLQAEYNARILTLSTSNSEEQKRIAQDLANELLRIKAEALKKLTDLGAPNQLTTPSVPSGLPGAPVSTPKPSAAPTQVGGIFGAIGDITGIHNADQAAKRLTQTFSDLFLTIRNGINDINNLYDAFASGEYFIDAFNELMQGTISTMDFLKVTAATVTAQIGQALAGALEAALKDGENFFAAFGRLLGQQLINMGLSLIAMAIAATAVGTIWGIFTGDWSRLAAALSQLPIALALGGTLIALGAAMGGLSSGGAAKAGSSASASAANAKTGASPDDNFDPAKDIRTIYQKALMAQITIDVRTDDATIVKTIIKHVNQNGRLTTLIGNRSLQFGY